LGSATSWIAALLITGVLSTVAFMLVLGAAALNAQEPVSPIVR